MIINKTTIAAIFINMMTTFMNAFEAAPTTWQKIAMLVPSTGKQNDYSWLSNFPKMRKWIGDKALATAASNRLWKEVMGVIGPRPDGSGLGAGAARSGRETNTDLYLEARAPLLREAAT